MQVEDPAIVNYLFIVRSIILDGNDEGRAGLAAYAARRGIVITTREPI